MPAAGRFVGEGHRAQEGSGSRPEMPLVGAAVAGPLVELDSADQAGGVGLELHAKLHRAGVRVGQNGRRRRGGEEAGCPGAGGVDREADAGEVRAAAAVGDGVGEARWAGVIGRRREGDGAGLGVEADRAVRRVADAGHAQRVAVRVRVVGQQRRGGDRNGGVGGGAEPAVVVGHRRLVGCGAGRVEQHVHPVVRRVVGAGREGAGRAIGIDAGACGRGERPVAHRRREVAVR